MALSVKCYNRAADAADVYLMSLCLIVCKICMSFLHPFIYIMCIMEHYHYTVLVVNVGNKRASSTRVRLFCNVITCA